MELQLPTYEVCDDITEKQILKKLEKFGRIAYQSKGGIQENSSANFVRKIIDRGHESVIEHVTISVIICCDRGITHEIVRHRIASYTQESTRYCNYGKKGVVFILPPWMKKGQDDYDEFIHDLEIIDNLYKKWLEKWKNPLTRAELPEKARYFLINGTKSQIGITFNLREWRHFFKLRTHSTAHPQMKEIVRPLLEEFKFRYPTIFGDIEWN